jgi:hypothetical protein
MAMTKKDTSVFGRHRAGEIREVVRDMRSKQIELTKEEFTAEELLDLFVHPDHQELMRQSYALVEPSGNMVDLYTHHPVADEYGKSSGYVRFRWHHRTLNDGFYVPHKKGAEERYKVTVNGNAKPENIAKFSRVWDGLMDVEWRFAMVERVFASLNGLLTTPGQMFYVWPCIMPLLRKAGMAEEAAKLERLTRAPVVALPDGVRSMLKETNDIVSAAFMLEDIAKPNNNSWPISYDIHVTISLSVK